MHFQGDTYSVFAVAAEYEGGINGLPLKKAKTIIIAAVPVKIVYSMHTLSYWLSNQTHRHTCKEMFSSPSPLSLSFSLCVWRERVSFSLTKKCARKLPGISRSGSVVLGGAKKNRGGGITCNGAIE